MRADSAKSKLTLWLENDAKAFGKNWAREHKDSLSHLLSGYLFRLKQAEKNPAAITPLVKRLSGVVKSKDFSRGAYRKHLVKKYLNA